MRHISKYLAIARISLLSNAVYGWDLLARTGFTAITLVIFTQLWMTTYAIDPSIQGLVSPQDIIWYLVLTQAIMMSTQRVAMRLDRQVKSGEISYFLLRPYNYLICQLAEYWGTASLLMPANFAVGGIIALIAVGIPTTTIVALVATGIAVGLALTVNFMIEALIGLTAFWFEDTQPFLWIYQKFLFTIGGLFLPLEFFPNTLRNVSYWLPFSAIIYTPAHLFTQYSLEAFIQLVTIQIGWIVILGSVLGVLYSIGIKTINVHGG